MIVRLSLIATCVAVVALTLSAADEAHPLKNAKVGDWVEYKMVSQFGGQNMEGSMKQTVTKKTDEEVTFEIVNKMAGREAPKQTVTLKLTEKFEPWKQPGSEVKEVGSGSEKVTVGDKTYSTDWKAMESVTAMGDQKIKQKIKVWTAKDVPLTGMVKMTAEIEGMGNTTMELTGAGSGA